MELKNDYEVKVERIICMGREHLILNNNKLNSEKNV